MGDEEEATSVFSAGLMICTTLLSVAFVVTCTVLKRRNGVGIGKWISEDPTSKSTPFQCTLCGHQHKIEMISDELQAKGWTCSACNGYNPSTEVSSGQDDQDLSDLEIQHTLGGLAISQTGCPAARASPSSWLHSIKDLNLLPEQTPNHTSSNGDVTEKNDQTLAVRTNSNGVTDPSLDGLSPGDGVKSTFTTRKHLIQPARLRVSKRQQSLSSATAALSLTGNGWSLSGQVTNGYSTNGSRLSNSFIGNGQSVNGGKGCLGVPGNFASTGGVRSAHPNHGTSTCCNVRPRLANWREKLKNDGMNYSYRRDNLNTLNSSGLNLSPTLMNNHHGNQHSPTMPSLTNPQPHPVVSSLNHTVVNDNKSPPTGKRVSCPVATLIFISLSTNVVLVLLLAALVYSPTAVSTIS